MSTNWTTAIGRAVAPTILASCVGAAGAADSPVDLVAVTAPAELAPHIASSNLAKECGIGQMTSDRVVEELKRRYPKVTTVASLPALADEQRALKLSVVDMYGLGGGGWSGAKSMTVSVEVVSAAGVVARRDFRRATRSLMGIASGTCPMMEKIASTVGGDIASWLEGAGRRSDVLTPPSAPAAPKPDVTKPAAAASDAENAASAPGH